ncbi:MAG: hypothetical protein U0574_11740 [Phycisphaerales bacterium]
MVSIEYGYDYSSNRTFAYDARFQSGWPMNHAYTNDPLNRLTAAMRATRTHLTGGTPTNGPDNTIGWDGYVFNATTADHLVRQRTYLPPLGRWGSEVESRRFREEVLQCLRTLCPQPSIDMAGNVVVPDEADETPRPGRGISHCGTDCSAVDRSRSPGCAMLRLLSKQGTLGIRPFEKLPEDRKPEMTDDLSQEGNAGNGWGPTLWWKRERCTGTTYGGCSPGECEVLWHEPAHAWRDAQGLLRTLPGGELSPASWDAAEAWEEIQTIDHVNTTLNPWFNCCVQDAKKGPYGKCWNWRNPREHGYVDEAIKQGLVDDAVVPCKPLPPKKAC